MLPGHLGGIALRYLNSACYAQQGHGDTVRSDVQGTWHHPIGRASRAALPAMAIWICGSVWAEGCYTLAVMASNKIKLDSYNWLVVDLPLWKIWVSWCQLVPNHQAVCYNCCHKGPNFVSSGGIMEKNPMDSPSVGINPFDDSSMNT